MTRNLEIIIGTYEEFLIGYRLDSKNDKEVLTQSFADKSHTGALKCLAVQGRWIATGATDDRIFIYDMKTRKQSQILLTHEGTINTLAFTPDGTHLLSGGADGRMIAVRLNTWFTEATWTKAHNGSAVTHICCHPSGKLALSLGSDLVLRTWNLVKGRVAYKTNLKSKSATLGLMPDCLSWSPSGDYFTLTGQRVVEIWSIKTADVVKSQKTASKPICVQWISNTNCLVGLEDGKIVSTSASVDDDKDGTEIKAHDARVKAMALHEDFLVTASSSGEVKLWRINSNTKKLKQIAATNTGCRPTCIGLLDLDQFGADYIITKTIEQKQEETQTKCEKIKKKPQERGVVTIEYDNEEDNKASTADSDEEDEDDEEVDSEADEDEVDEDDDDHNDDVDDKDDNDDDDDDDDDDDADSNSEDDEPQIPLPRSRKRKQEILGKQNLAKSPKLNVNSKNSKQKNQKTSHQSVSNTASKKQKKPKVK